MKTSFKSKLIELIRAHYGVIVWNKEIKELCEQEGKKLSNAERRLRQSESPSIISVGFDGKDLPIGNTHITVAGYRWKSGILQELHAMIPEKPKVKQISFKI